MKKSKVLVEKIRSHFQRRPIWFKFSLFLAILAIALIGFSIYSVKTRQISYETRVIQNDGKLYPQEEPIGLVQRVVNNPTHESENLIINLLQYFYRMVAVNFNTDEMAKSYCCELIERYKTQPYYIWAERADTHHKYEIIEKNNNMQLIGVRSSNPDYKGMETEIYFTVVKTTGGWKVDKYRVFGSINDFYSYINHQTDPEYKPTFVDENMNKSYTVSLDSAGLALKNDFQLIDYFKMHKDRFYELKRIIDSQDIAFVFIDEFLEEQQSTKDFLSDLKLTTVVGNYNNYCETCMFFIIAGTQDNTVGYFFIPDKSKLPKITGNGLIIIREIEDGWYFYKGT